MSKPLIISVDFDGTCVEGDFPEIGAPMPGAVEVLREITRRGHKVVLSTCRENAPKRKYLDEALAWFKAHGIPLRSANENHVDDDFRESPSLRRKIYSDFHVDDRNLGGFPGWHAVLAEVDRRRPR